jgi:hypothetical protein
MIWVRRGARGVQGALHASCAMNSVPFGNNIGKALGGNVRRRGWL